jgi:hypothetical protein
MTPNELAAELRTSARALRAFLRREYGNLASQSETRWQLTSQQIERARSHFTRPRVSSLSIEATEQSAADREPRAPVPTPDRRRGWSDLLAAPRTRSSILNKANIPAEPGLYAWFRGEECVYLGIAGDLRARLTTHRGTSRDLSRSTFRSWVAVHVLGLDRAVSRQRPSVVTDEQARVVNDWIAACDIAWLVQPTRKDAAVLETALLLEHKPLLNAA